MDNSGEGNGGPLANGDDDGEGGESEESEQAVSSDSDEEVTIAELRAQLTDARKRARVAEIEEAGGVMAMARRQAQQRARRNFDDDPDL